MRVALLAFALIAFPELFRRGGKWPALIVFLALPLILTPQWFAINDFDWFQWVKLFSVLFCVVWGTVLRFTSMESLRWARSTIPLLLAANIVEAAINDCLAGDPAHLLNAAAGLTLIATIPFGATRTWVSGANCDLLTVTSRTWIVGYTIWNGTFVYLNYPELAGHHVAVLGATLVVGMFAPHRWTQARAHTLGLHLMLSASAYRDVCDWLPTSDWKNEVAGLTVATVSCWFAILVAALETVRRSGLVRRP